MQYNFPDTANKSKQGGPSGYIEDLLKLMDNLESNSDI